MIGAMTPIARQVALETGRDILRGAGERGIQRLMAGEELEGILTKEHIKKAGQAGLTSFLEKSKDFLLEDYNRKNEDWNGRMNKFARNLNDHFKKHRTLYAEEKM